MRVVTADSLESRENQDGICNAGHGQPGRSSKESLWERSFAYDTLSTDTRCILTTVGTDPQHPLPSFASIERTAEEDYDIRINIMIASENKKFAIRKNGSRKVFVH